jgi:hypothetical protein
LPAATPCGENVHWGVTFCFFARNLINEITMRIPSKILAPALGSAFLMGCGTGTGSASPSGPPVDPSKNFSDLSASEMQAFCDWLAQQEGGYGSTTQCDASNVPLEAPQDQAMCVTEFFQHASEPGCSGTVGQWTTCIDWLDANWCTPTPATRPAECNVIQATCYGSGTLADGGVE